MLPKTSDVVDYNRDQIVPHETFIECCGTNAALVVELEDGDIAYVDLASGNIGYCSLFRCGPVVLEPMTALAIGLLGSVYSEQKAAAYRLVTDIDDNFKPTHSTDMVMQIMNEQRNESRQK